MKKLLSMRVKRGMKQAEVLKQLAGRVTIRQALLSEVENNEIINPSVALTRELCRIYGCGPRELLTAAEVDYFRGAPSGPKRCHMSPDTTRYSVTFTNEEARRVEAVAALVGLRTQDLIRRLVTDYMDKLRGAGTDEPKKTE